jgi:hypothetical protein
MLLEVNPRKRTLAWTMNLALALLSGCAAYSDEAEYDPELEDEETVEVSEAALLAARFDTFTVGNGGQNLAVVNGNVVTVPPSSSSASQQFELIFPAGAGSSEPGFGSAFQLKSRETGKCLRDAGEGLPIRLVTCSTNVGANSSQLWQHHIAVDRVANGKDFFFLFNRFSDRVLSRAPEFGNQVPVLSSVQASNVFSAAAALQLWNRTRL